jgi:hypothetical protein
MGYAMMMQDNKGLKLFFLFIIRQRGQNTKQPIEKNGNKQPISIKTKTKILISAWTLTFTVGFHSLNHESRRYQLSHHKTVKIA